MVRSLADRTFQLRPEDMPALQTVLPPLTMVGALVERVSAAKTAGAAVEVWAAIYVFSHSGLERIFF